MVRLQLPTSKTCPPFQLDTINISIHHQGDQEASSEYPSRDADPNKSFVVAKLDSPYSIHFTITSPLADPTKGKFLQGYKYLKAKVYIDGKCMDSSFLKRRGTTVVSGRRDGNVKRPFVFARPILVPNGGLLEKEGVDSLGTIRIELWPVLLVSRKCPNTKEYVGLNAPVVNERAKKGVFISSTTKLGNPFVATTCKGLWNVNTLTETPLATYTYHYKTREFLEVEEIIPNPMAARAVFDVKDDVKPEMKANYTQYVNPELESIPFVCNVKVENAFVKAESVDGGRSIKRTASAAENDSDGEIEYLGEAPPKKKVVELIDLTLD